MNNENEFFVRLLRRPVRVYLVNGVCLEGELLGACDDAIFLSDREHRAPHLIYKTGITSVSSDEPQSASQCVRTPRSVRIY